jgi:hypothetical protein
LRSDSAACFLLGLFLWVERKRGRRGNHAVGHLTLLGAVLISNGEALISAFHVTLLIAAAAIVMAGTNAWLTVSSSAALERKAAEA